MFVYTRVSVCVMEIFRFSFSLNYNNIIKADETSQELATVQDVRLAVRHVLVERSVPFVNCMQ